MTRNLFVTKHFFVIDAKDVRSSMIECSRCVSIRRSSKHDVRDVSRYDARRALKNVFELITLTMFSVRSCVKCHVNVIT